MIVIAAILLLISISQKAKDRFTSEEKRALDRANHYLYEEIRQSAEAHRQVRHYVSYTSPPT